MAPEGGDTWLSPALGCVRANLKAVEIEAAEDSARRALETAEEKWQTYEQLPAQASGALRAGGGFRVDSRPPRPSVVAFRIGQQFWDEGEPDTAAHYFGESLRIEPNGATRARIALARIALINEDFPGALDLARRALTIGQFHAKTLSAWPIAITAAHALKTPDIVQQLSRGLAQAVPAVRGRARLLIARSLRDLGNPAWAIFTELSHSEDPDHVLAAEFAKMNLASAIQAREPAQRIVQLARQIMTIPNIVPREWLAAAKTIATALIAEERNPGINRLLADGIKIFGPSHQGEFALGLANACLDAEQPARAIPVLQRIVDANQGDDTWSRATSTLAKTFQNLGDLPAAIPLYDRVARAPGVPERFQLYARLEWLRAVVATGNTAALSGAREEIVNVARRLDDFELLLDLARQMTLAPAEIAAAANEIFDRAEQLARRAFQAELLPDAATLIAFKLFRRQTDLGRYPAITTAWEALSEKKKLWLWSPQSAYWELIGLVAAAYRAQANPTAATALLDGFLTDPATPPEGLAIIGIPEALTILNAGDLTTALQTFMWICDQSPTHPLCAYAYYWFALRDYRGGSGVADQLQRLRLALGDKPGLAWKRDLAARAALLAADLDITKAESPEDETFLRSQLTIINRDLQAW